jgi:hypothetical protein
VAAIVVVVVATKIAHARHYPSCRLLRRSGRAYNDNGRPDVATSNRPLPQGTVPALGVYGSAIAW